MHVEEKSVQGIVSQRIFLILTRVATLCVYTKSAHTQVFSGIFVRIFTRRKCRKFRHRAAASAVGGLCRGLRGWYVSVLFHSIYCSFCPFQAAHVLRTYAKVSAKRFPAKDFGGHLLFRFFTLVVPFIHVVLQVAYYQSVAKPSFSCFFRMFFRSSSGFTPNFFTKKV